MHLACLLPRIPGTASQGTGVDVNGLSPAREALRCFPPRNRAGRTEGRAVLYATCIVSREDDHDGSTGNAHGKCTHPLPTSYACVVKYLAYVLRMCSEVSGLRPTHA